LSREEFSSRAAAPQRNQPCYLPHITVHLRFINPVQNSCNSSVFFDTFGPHFPAMKKTSFILAGITIATAFTLFNCGPTEVKDEDTGLAARVDSFLTGYNEKFRELSIASNEATWILQTHMVDDDTVASYNAKKTSEAIAEFTGSKENIEMTREFLAKKDKLTALQVEQLDHILYLAGGNPATEAATVKERITAETQAVEMLYNYKYMLDGKEVTKNDIDRILSEETNLEKRLAAWNCAKSVGERLHSPLENLRMLRNRTVQGLDYPDYFSYQVADYGMSAEEMMTTLRGINDDIYPLYRELHTWARYELAKKYGVAEVPDYLPAHWLPNQWGQDWSDIVNVEGFDLDKIIAEKKYDSLWIVKQAESYYVSMGFDPLPQTFYDKSDLFPLPVTAPYKKNNHASAWHMDYAGDVRSLMSVQPNARWYETTHHELGHIYYYMQYSNDSVPYIMREGANRAYHEALGTMFGMAAMQKPFLEGLNLVDPKMTIDTTQQLLKEALRYIVALNWQAGTMSEFEYELYSQELPAGSFNKRWWEIVKREQGIVPPMERGEQYCDAASKTHIIDDPAQYYDYALSSVLMFQFHSHIASNILKQDPRFTNYYGNKDIGKFVGDMMAVGAVGDWRVILREKTGQDLTAKPMLDYFAPLMTYLKKVNEGRKYTLPEKREH
jgi:peptidyl-dipeptidase A